MSKKESFIREKAVKYKVDKFTNQLYPEHIEGKGDEEGLVHYMSEEEFLKKAPDNKIWELRYGELIIHSPVYIVHQQLLGFLMLLMGSYVNSKEIGTILTEPFCIRFEKDLIYEPDITFISKKNPGKVEKIFFDGVPNLIVEIVSPSMILHDRRTKFVDYERFGVKEYWILDPVKKKYNFYRNMRKKFKEILPEEGIYKSKEIEGFYIKLEWLEDKKYWSERNVNKITYKLIGKKSVIKDIGEKEILEDIADRTLIDEVIKRIGKGRLKKLIE